MVVKNQNPKEASKQTQPDIVAHACNTSTQESHKFKASQGSIVRPCLKKQVNK